VIGGNRQIELIAQLGDDIEVGYRRFHHQNICAFVHIEGRFAQGLAAVGGIHLVAAPVAELGCAIGGISEGSVKC
jgi:hypothetical protein